MNNRQQTNYIVVHCSATRPGAQIGAAEIDQWHRARGWDCIGYHAVIRRDGRLEFGRPFDAVGAHTKGHNFESVGICLVGGLDARGNPEDNFTPVQKRIARWLIEALLHAYPGAEVLGHRDLSPDTDGDGVINKHEWVKDCPCFDVRQWWASE